jgi:hypothetical protein
LLLGFDRAEDPLEPPAQVFAAASVDAAPAGPVSPELLAAIAVAVRAHRRMLRRQAAPTMRQHPPGTLHSRWVGSGRTRQNRSWVAGGRHV